MSVPRSIVFLIPTELNPRSNGHACILTLAKELQAVGYDVSLLPIQPYRFFRRYWQKLPKVYRQLRFLAHPSEALQPSFLVVPESTPRGLLNKLRPYFQDVLWWILAPSGLLTNYKPAMRVGDLMLPFSSFTLPYSPNYLFVHPPVDDALAKTNRIYLPHRLQLRSVCLYTGKGRLKALPRPLHRAMLGLNIRLITRAYPSTRQKLINLLSDSRGLISFDPLTNLNLEAGNLGVPVYLPGNPFPPVCFTDFPIDLAPYVTDDAEVFLARLAENAAPKKLSFQLFRSLNSQAVALMIRVFTDVSFVDSLRMKPETLHEINRYSQTIKSTRTIQTLFNGSALSSCFTLLYVSSLKLPSWIHIGICKCLCLIDLVADALAAIGLYRILQPFIGFFVNRLFSVGSRLRRLPPISWF
ncbi:MAG: hypothetical protein ACK5QQ_15455 [Cyanobacteriota bacterium]